MTTTLERLCRALAAAFAAAVLAAPVLHAAESALTPDAGVAEARAALREGRPAEALEVLRPLARRHPEHMNIRFLLGLAAIEAARMPGVAEADREALLDEAIVSLFAVLIDQPGLVRVRLELARAFFYKEEDSLARRHFERVLAGDVPGAVKANVQRFLSQIRARRRWTAYLGASLVPDTNIGGASDDEIIYIDVFGAELPFTRSPEDLPTSGVGASLWTGGGYEHPLTHRLRLRAGVDLAHKDHAGRRFDDTHLALHAGPRWLADPRTELSVLVNASRRWLGGSVEHDAAGARIEAHRRLADRVWASVHASWLDHDYRGGTGRDGPVVDLLLSGTWRVRPTVSFSSAIGYSEQRAHAARFENRSRRVRAGLNVALPRGFSMGGSAQVRWTDYPDYQFFGRSFEREDRTRTLSVSLHKRDFTLYGFSPQLVVTHERRDSNAQALDSVGNRAELRLVRQF